MKQAIRDKITEKTDGKTFRVLRGPLRGVFFRSGNHLNRRIFAGLSEQENQAVFTALIGEGETVLDVGANVGMHSFLYSRLVGHSGHVHMIEPLPANIEQLKWGVEKNGLENVTLHTFAAWSEDTELTFSSDADTSAASLVQDKGPGATHITVQCRPLDDVAKEFGLAVDFIKMDIEGAESEALKSMNHIISTTKPTLFFESHGLENDLSIGKALKDHNYVAFRVLQDDDAFELVPVEDFEAPYPAPTGVWGAILGIHPDRMPAICQRLLTSRTRDILKRMF